MRRRRESWSSPAETECDREVRVEDDAENEADEKHRQALLKALGLSDELKMVSSAAVNTEEIDPEEDEVGAAVTGARGYDIAVFDPLDDDLDNIDKVVRCDVCEGERGGGGSRDSRCWESRLRDRRAKYVAKNIGYDSVIDDLNSVDSHEG